LPPEVHCLWINYPSNTNLKAVHGYISKIVKRIDYQVFFQKCALETLAAFTMQASKVSSLWSFRSKAQPGGGLKGLKRPL